VGNTY